MSDKIIFIDDFTKEDKEYFEEVYERAILKDPSDELVDLFVVKYFTEIIGLRPEFNYSIENKIMAHKDNLKMNVLNDEFIKCKNLINKLQKSKKIDDLLILYDYSYNFIKTNEHKYSKIMIEKTRLESSIKCNIIKNDFFLISAVKDINYMFSFLCNKYIII